MDWSGIGDLLTYVGTFLGGGWLLSLYKAKPEKTNLEIKNLREAMEAQREVVGGLKDRVGDLSREVTALHHRVDMKHEVIYSAYGCRLIKMPEDCVVLQEYEKKCLSCSLHEGVNACVEEGD